MNINRIVDRALTELQSRQPDLEIDRLRHGLTVWTVARRGGERVEMAVLRRVGEELVIYSDAYADEELYSDAVVQVLRLMASDDDVASTRQALALPGRSEKEIERWLLDGFERALERAKKLKLTKPVVISYATPFGNG